MDAKLIRATSLYKEEELIHTPTSLSSQPHFDANGELITVLTQMTITPAANVAPEPRRRMPNYVQIADAYVFQQTIDDRLERVGVTQAREDSIRLAGVHWVDSVRKALKLPVRTFDTAVIYYHKFRLVHSDGEYGFVDAAAAALFAACKVEDTLKKSRDILCAAHNLKVPRADHLSADDPIFDHQARSIIGLERLMLEASGFDFRNRHPHHLFIKLAKHHGYTKSSPITHLAYKISLDLYRTFAPLKQSTATLAFACLELADRLSNPGEATSSPSHLASYASWSVTRATVMETLLDLLELYTHHRTSTAIGASFSVDAFLAARIPLNAEIERDVHNLPRYTYHIDRPSALDRVGHENKIKSNAAPANAPTGPNGTHRQHSRGSSKNVSPKDGNTAANTSPSTKTDSSAGVGSGSTAATSVVNGTRQRVGERGRDGTVRFMLNPDRERDEQAVIAEYSSDATPLETAREGVGD